MCSDQQRGTYSVWMETETDRLLLSINTVSLWQADYILSDYLPTDKAHYDGLSWQVFGDFV